MTPKNPYWFFSPFESSQLSGGFWSVTSLPRIVSLAKPTSLLDFCQSSFLAFVTTHLHAVLDRGARSCDLLLGRRSLRDVDPQSLSPLLSLVLELDHLSNVLCRFESRALRISWNLKFQGHVSSTDIIQSLPLIFRRLPYSPRPRPALSNPSKA